MRHLVFVAVGLMVTTGAAFAQDVEAGEKSFRKCAPCHNIGPDATNKVGPELNGINGRKSGTVAGFNYSDAKILLISHGHYDHCQVAGRVHDLTGIDVGPLAGPLVDGQLRRLLG